MSQPCFKVEYRVGESILDREVSRDWSLLWPMLSGRLRGSASAAERLRSNRARCSLRSKHKGGQWVWNSGWQARSSQRWAILMCVLAENPDSVSASSVHPATWPASLLSAAFVIPLHTSLTPFCRRLSFILLHGGSSSLRVCTLALAQRLLLTSAILV